MNRRHAEVVLLVGGACLLIKGGWNLANYAAFQQHPEWYMKAGKSSAVHNTELQPRVPITFRPVTVPDDLEVLGKLEVPRLGMSVLVVEGDDDQKLGLAAGHLTGSADFGQKGNAVVAGHRDTSFWPLRHIRIGDRVRIRGAKTYVYVVNNIRVVEPTDISVLGGSTDKSKLTIVTCYPFRYFGAAPKRFIVQAVIPRS